MSWDDIGLEVKDDRHKLMWRYCADLSHVTATPPPSCTTSCRVSPSSASMG